MKEYQYYPGCSVSQGSGGCQRSLMSVASALGFELKELKDWNCCGAAGYVSVDDLQGLTLASRNLASAEVAGGGDLITPCGACHQVLSGAKYNLDMYPDVRVRVCGALAAAGLRYCGRVRVRHLLDVLLVDVGEQRIAEQVARGLSGLRVATYYGCQFFHSHSSFSAHSDPGPLERLVTVAGAEALELPSRLRCCGGVQLRGVPGLGLPAVRTLLEEAHELGADAVVTGCAACQHNFATHQLTTNDGSGIPAMPVLYIAQLLGLALGLPASELGLDQGLAPIEPIQARRAEHVA